MRYETCNVPEHQGQDLLMTTDTAGQPVIVCCACLEADVLEEERAERITREWLEGNQ